MTSDLSSNVTFVVATFKRRDFLENCLNSILEKYPKAGVVVVNDDPADDLPFNSYPQVFYHRNSRNLGCPQSRNVGANLVKTSYAFFLDDDGVLGDVDIERAVRLMDGNETIAVCGFSARNHIGGGVNTTGIFSQPKISPFDFYDTPAFNGGASLIRMSFFCPEGYNPRIRGYGEEAELTLRALSSGLRVVSLKNGGAIDHFPSTVSASSNSVAQRANDIATAFNYGGFMLGSRQFLAHTYAALKVKSLRQILGCLRGLIQGITILNTGDRRRKMIYRNWLQLARKESI